MNAVHTERVAAPGRRNLYDVDAVRRDFPILAETVRGRPLVYLDNAATAQKPRAVIDAVRHYYEHDNANVHRGVHTLSERATAAYEGARDRVRDYIGAADRAEVVFTRGTTEAVNLVAQAWGRARLGPEDEVLITTMEHHSNIVPWQMLCRQTGATLRWIPVNDAGELDLEAFHRLLGPRTRMVALVHLSNSLGTINPVEEIIAAARAAGARVLIDGAQAIPHMPVDVQALGCDFYAFSGHKVFAPTGLGVLWGRRDLLEEMDPWQGGGDMIRTVSIDGSTWNELPYKFEAGTPHISGAIGLAAALDYLEGIGADAVAAHEAELLEHATRAVGAIPGVRLIGTAARKAGVLAFVVEGIHAHDIGTILDRQGVAVRAGHHCTMPLMQRFGVAATARASFALYNTRDEADALAAAIVQAKELFGR
jgi:cysteine desulfurase / selenocysteine lyase